MKEKKKKRKREKKKKKKENIRKFSFFTKTINGER